MGTSIYIINPKADFPTYFGAEMVQGWGMAPATAFPDLTIATVAAMLPPTFEVRLCDENLTPVDFNQRPDFIAITGKVSQWERMQEIAAEYRRRGRTIVIGGPLATLSPELVRGHCDILVRGEIEEIATDLFSDLESGTWKEEYIGTRPSMDKTPPPRWDLYPNDRVLLGTLQTSRGCPYSCEFCDVIQYLGQKQRHRSIPKVLEELDELYRLGYRSVFIADDNFTVMRRHAKQLLTEMAKWNNRRQDGKVTFSTQLSIDTAGDDEMLRLCAEAGLIQAFIGIETPNEESLKESKKKQNMGINLVDQVQKFYDHGIGVTGGMIVGFDNDDTSIFERQYAFATSASLPIVTLGALVAPAATPLHYRMEKAGRLLMGGSQVAAMPWSTNIRPLRMSQENLLQGIQWLANKLYRPEAFTRRAVTFLARLGDRQDPKYLSRLEKQPAPRSIENEGGAILKKLISMGKDEAKMVYTLLGILSKKPQHFDFVKTIIFQYAQIRFMYEKGQIWNEQLDLEFNIRQVS